ncbi:MAG TPA: hypothetical protein VFG30_33335 [Polyangiales bacterium]|jgi:hypothetical protein|nr:hypothetical protein [Polyangiales bacterium]
MGTTDRGRKQRDMVATREEPASVPPPARRKRERHELDPEMLWDKETDEAAEDSEGEEESAEAEDGWNEEGGQEEPNYDDLDDWDHPIRRLKIN